VVSYPSCEKGLSTDEGGKGKERDETGVLVDSVRTRMEPLAMLCTNRRIERMISWRVVNEGARELISHLLLAGGVKAVGVTRSCHDAATFSKQNGEWLQNPSSFQT